MSDPSIRREDLAAALVARHAGPGEEASHPTPERLLAYHLGETGAAESAEVADHLCVCESCTMALMDLADLAAAAPVDLDDAERAAWDELLPVLQPSELLEPAPREPAPRASRPTSLYALAAVLAAAVLGLGLWVAQLRHHLADLSRAELNLPVAYLDPVSRGAEEDGGELTLPATGRRFLLMITPAEPEPGRTYGVEVATGEGEVVWRGDGARASRYGSLRIALPTEPFPAGEYVVRLLDADGKATGEVYPLRLRGAPAADSQRP